MNAPEPERLARAALSRLAEPGSVTMTRLVEELGAVQLLQALRDQSCDPALHERIAPRLRDLDPATELERAGRQGIRFVVPGDAEWPTQLDELATADPVEGRGGRPIGLWVRGPGHLGHWEESVALVGSRSATGYGVAAAGDIAAGLSRAGHGIVSGAAFGIDVAAHRAALGSRGRTLAVLACGVDRIYPEAHRDLIHLLRSEHLVVSEAAPGCAPMRARFLARNRLIAGLARGTVVVEAAARSGALSTAAWAGRLNRALMGVPGPITSAASVGVHQLFRRGAATVVTSADEVLEMVTASGEHLATEPQGDVRSRDRLSRKQQRVLDALPRHRSAEVESVARAAGLGVGEVVVELRALNTLAMVEVAGRGWRLTELAL